MMIGSTRKDKLPKDNLVSVLHPSEFTTVEIAALNKKGKDKDKLHLIMEMSRIGGGLFMVKLEYTHFPPRTEKNKLFEMALMEWPSKESLRWAIVSIPIEYKPDALKIAAECGLRFADGIPTLFGEGKAQQFPLDGETVFTIENMAGHKGYSNNPEVIKKLREEEDLACREIIEADQVKIKAEMIEEGYSLEQIERIFKEWETSNVSYDERPVGKRG